MLYLTVDDFRLRYPRTAPNIATGVTSLQLASFIDEAGGEGDGYLAKAGITVPVSPAPAVLVGKVAALAYGIFLQRQMHEADKEGGIAAMMKDARDWFKGVADGSVTLVISGGVNATGDTQVRAWSNLDPYTPTFGAGDIEDMVVDDDRIDDEEDAR